MKTNKVPEETTKLYSEIKLAVICREISPIDGSIDIRLCELTTLDKVMVFPLKIRQRYNNNLKYYYIEEKHYNNESTREYLFDLIREEKKSSLIIDVEEI